MTADDVGQRNILITGCSSGIGLACARGMKARGWHVLATARKAEDLAMLRAEGLHAVALDYADATSIAACAETVLAATGGRLDALFNNGAYGQTGAVEDVPTDVLRAQFEANFFGWHDLTCRLIPAMRAQGHGRIVQCSSVLGFVALKYRGPYVASKFALEGLSDAMRLELRPAGIHVSLIQPGPIETRFMDTALAVFRRTIDPSTSAHRDDYQRQIARLTAGTGNKSGIGRFRLPAEAILPPLVHACESARPRARYRVTVPTKAMALARRLLPAAALDRILAKNQ